MDILPDFKGLGEHWCLIQKRGLGVLKWVERFFLKTGSCYVAQARLELLTFLLQPPQC
jgi:hypothetical protein